MVYQAFEQKRFAHQIADLEQIQAHVKATSPYVRIAFKKQKIIKDGTKVIAEF